MTPESILKTLCFFSFAFGSAFSLGIVLATVAIPSAKTFAAFTASTVLMGFLACFFGIRAFADYRRAKAKLEAIKR